jgi:hypothetical protein
MKAASFLGKRRQATASWEVGRNSLLESAQEATLLSLAISCLQRQSIAWWFDGRQMP